MITLFTAYLSIFNFGHVKFHCDPLVTVLLLMDKIIMLESFVSQVEEGVVFL